MRTVVKFNTKISTMVLILTLDLIIEIIFWCVYSCEVLPLIRQVDYVWASVLVYQSSPLNYTNYDLGNAAQPYTILFSRPSNVLPCCLVARVIERFNWWAQFSDGSATFEGSGGMMKGRRWNINTVWNFSYVSHHILPIKWPKALLGRYFVYSMYQKIINLKRPNFK